jgi:hypothetical protein
MDLDQIQPQLEKFTVFGVESRPGMVVLGALAAVAVALWVATAMLRSVVRFVVAVAEAVTAVLANLSAVLVAGLIVVVLTLTG